MDRLGAAEVGETQKGNRNTSSCSGALAGEATNASLYGEAVAAAEELSHRYIWLTALLGAVALSSLSQAALGRLLRRGCSSFLECRTPPALRATPPSALVMRAAGIYIAVSLCVAWSALACALAMQHVSVIGGLSLLCAMFFVMASYPFSPLRFAETLFCLFLPMTCAYAATMALLRADSFAIYPLDVKLMLLAGACGAREEHFSPTGASQCEKALGGAFHDI